MQRSRVVSPIVLLLAAILLCLGSAAIAQPGGGCPPDIIAESRAGVTRARSVLPAGATSIQPKHETACRHTSQWLHRVLTAEALGSDPPQWDENPSQPKRCYLTPYLTPSGGERMYATWETAEFRFCCASSIAHFAITATPKLPPKIPPANRQEIIAGAEALTKRLLLHGEALASDADLQESGTMYYRFVYPDDSTVSPDGKKRRGTVDWLRYLEVVTDGKAVTFVLKKDFRVIPWIPTEGESWFDDDLRSTPVPPPMIPPPDDFERSGRTPVHSSEFPPAKQ